MAQATLDRILNDLGRLGEEDLRRLDEAVRERLGIQNDAAREEAFLRALQASGLVREIKRRPLLREDDTPLIRVEGESVSETIIRERR